MEHAFSLISGVMHALPELGLIDFLFLMLSMFLTFLIVKAGTAYAVSYCKQKGKDHASNNNKKK